MASKKEYTFVPATRTVSRLVETRKPGVKVLPGQPLPKPDNSAIWTVDFAGVVPADANVEGLDTVFELAASSVIITAQNKLRTKGTDSDWALGDRTFDVAAMQQREERTAAPAPVKIRRAAKEMSNEQLIETLKELAKERGIKIK